MVQQYGGPNTGLEPGNETEVGIGQYDAEFENQVFSLKNIGDISKPFLTSYGYNIIKLIAIEPVNRDGNDVVNRAHLQELIEQDQRLALAKEKLTEKWMQQTKYANAVYNAKDLWAYSDSE